MRYERRGMDVASRAPRSRRQRRIVSGVAAVVVVVAGVFFGVNVSKGPHRVVLIPGIAKPYLEANILIQNLGSPAPVGVTSTSWSIHGDELLDATSAPRLAAPERHWMTPTGTLIPLTSREAAAITSSQRELADSIMTGHLLHTTMQQLTQLVTGERRARPKISSPGGGSVLTWYSITPTGNTATVDATVEIWEQVDELVATPSGLRITSSINQAEIEGKATLVRAHGTWKVATLDQQPYQQAT